MSKATTQEISDADEFQMRRLLSKLNMADWTIELDQLLQSAIVQSYFNFDLVCVEINQKAREQAFNTANPIGARDRFTVEHCRLRWSYIHLVRKIDQEPAYTPQGWNKHLKSPTRGHSAGKENQDSSNSSNSNSKSTSRSKAAKQSQVTTIAKESPRVIKPIKEVLDEKTKNYLQKKPLKNFHEIEGQLWKNNITFSERQKKDFLDVSNEDFSKYETVDIMGNRATPSNFNIFRDSLRANKQAMHQKMLENLPDMALNDIDSDASGSDSEIVPLDFRTAMINNGTKLVIQARPKDYISVEQEMKAVEQGRFSEIDSKIDPDKAIGDLDAYLRSVHKEAFDVDDENVVLIDPGQAAESRYADIKLPCDQESRINNSITATQRPQSKKSAQAKKANATMTASNSSMKLNQTLRQAEKQSAQQTPEYYDRQIKAEQDAYVRSQMPKGPIFHVEPEKNSDDSEEEAVAAVMGRPNLNFNDILQGMGGAGIFSSGGESGEEEEKKEAPYGQSGVRVFRPNLSASGRFTEDMQSTQQDSSLSELQREFDQHLAKPGANPVPTESDSDTAPCAAIVDEREETDEERKEKKIQSTEESARLASSEDEEGKQIRRVQSAKAQKVNANTIATAVQPNESNSSDDDQWFQQQRRKARANRPQTAVTKEQTQADAEKKRQEREVLMRKLKQQAEETRKRKAQAKKEKGWVGGSTTPRDVVSPKVSKIDITSKAGASFDFEALD